MQNKSSDKPVWKKKKPKATKSIKLTPEQKNEAKERATKAGRKYPNLIDNMYISQKVKKMGKIQDKANNGDDI